MNFIFLSVLVLKAPNVIPVSSSADARVDRGVEPRGGHLEEFITTLAEETASTTPEENPTRGAVNVGNRLRERTAQVEGLLRNMLASFNPATQPNEITAADTNFTEAVGDILKELYGGDRCGYLDSAEQARYAAVRRSEAPLDP